MHRIIIASDSFKGSLSSMEVAHAAAQGIRSVFPGCETLCIETADGGEATARALTSALGGATVSAEVSDPLGRTVTAEYGIIEENGTKTAVIGMSQASGLTLLSPDERNPLHTSTYGTGEMIIDAIGRGCGRFMVGIGGSATNDGGTGMLEALGCRFMGKDGRAITGLCGKKLTDIASIDRTGMVPELKECSFVVACDVDFSNLPDTVEKLAVNIFDPNVDIYNLAKKLHIEADARRIVFLIETKQEKDTNALETVRSLFAGKSRDFRTNTSLAKSFFRKNQ